MDLWPNILRHLETQDRMRARLACKAFSKLGPNDCIRLQPMSGHPQHLLSLLRFCFAQTRLSEKGAMLEVKFIDKSYDYDHGDLRSPFRPCLYAALSCANLRKLHLAIKFAQGEAEMIVQLAPDGLQSLWLTTDMTLLGSNAWRHLQALTKLELEAQHGPAKPVHATALASLPSLQELAITGHDYGRTPCLDASDVVMPNLQKLSLSWTRLPSQSAAASVQP